MLNIRINLCCLLFAFSSLCAQIADVDTFLERVLSKTSIVSRKQIKIPGYPHAYNPSLIPYKEGYLLSFRCRSGYPKTVEHPLREDVSLVGVVKLDPEFQVDEESIQLLHIASYAPYFSLTAEDARLLHVGHRIFLFFNDLPPLQSPGKNVMYFGELVQDRGLFVLKEPAKPLQYANAITVEKNWSPFVSGDRLYLIYSDQPRVILEVDMNTGHCQEVARTSLDWNWSLGQIRGGTPAYPIDDTFLTFFHSSFPAKISKKRAYVMGAYTFDKDPPFSIRTMTPRPLGDVADYTEDNSSKIVFPGGMVIESKLIHVAWGKADKQIFITTLDREKLLASMKSVVN